MNEQMTQEKPLVSIIVPVYNVEKYLQACLESLARQTYPALEIILIDDGSTDSSGKMCDEFAQKDPRFKVVHQANGGLSNARNHGIQLAQGEYLTFVDSDDTVTADYVTFLYELLETKGFKSPMSICALNNVYLATGVEKNDGNGLVTTLSGKKAIEMMCYHDLVDTCAYAKLAKKELYETVAFPEGKIFEDIATTYQLFMQCDSIECGFLPKYNYMLRSGSITTSGFNAKKLELLEMTDQMAQDVVARYPDLASAVKRRQVYARFSTLNQMLDVTDPDLVAKRNAIIKYLKANQAQVVSDPKTPKRDKLGYLMLKFGFPMYKVAWKNYLKVKGHR